MPPDGEKARHLLAELERWNEEERGRRETNLAVKSAMRGILSEYSFQREESLRLLFKVARGLLAKRGDPAKDALAGQRGESVTITERVLRSIFPKTPPPSVLHTMCRTTNTEKNLAMASLEGLCNLSAREQIAFLEARGFLTVLEEVNKHIEATIGPAHHVPGCSPRGVPTAWGIAEPSLDLKGSVSLVTACLDTVLIGVVDYPEAQHQILDIELIPPLVCLLKSERTDLDLKYKILEFLSILSKIYNLPPGPGPGRQQQPNLASGGGGFVDSYYLSAGPVPPHDSQTPAQRLVEVLTELLGDVVEQLPACATVRNPPAPSQAQPSNRSTSREHDLRVQADVIARLSSLNSP
ncbi:hypothetical protein DIPPA_05061 [Diplonema papillatum]|nr:hypothetical protein DIPPA_05061 [Diplonema papillatum]